MNIQQLKNRLVPCALLAALLLGPLSAQVRPPTMPVQQALPAATNAAHDHAHAPGQLEIAPERLQAIRAASAANRSARLLQQPNAAQCTNGDFQSPNFLGWSGKDGTVATGPTVTWLNNFISQGASSGTTPGNNSINTSTAHQTLVTTGTDSYAPISTTAPTGSTMAARIGNGVNGQGAEALTKTFTVTQATMNFWYALVLENPSSPLHSAAEQPGFMIRVTNSSGVDITSKLANATTTRPPRVFVTSTSNVVAADATNPFFKVSPKTGPNGVTVVYKDWSCSSIDLGDLIGQTVTIEFITTDCTKGAHAGWAYIDDVCGVCSGTPDGTVTLNQAASTACGPGKLCFDFTIPKAPGAASGTTQLSLQLYQNGIAVGAPIVSPVQNADGQYCFPMIPAVTPPLNASLPGFDWVVTSTNKIGSTTLTPKFVGTVPNGVVNGTNNDYAMTCGPGTVGGGNTCCPPMDNATISGLFDHAGNVANSYTEKFGSTAQSAANVAAFIKNYDAYLTMMKWSCPSVVSLRVDFNLYQTTAIGGPLTGTPLATNTLAFSGGSAPTGSTSFFNVALNNNQFYGIHAITTALDANGRPVQCGFDKKCLEDDRYTWNHQVGSKLASPGASMGR